MKCINFDRAFEKYMGAWVKENSEKYKDNMDVIENMMPDVYMEFLQKPADFLDGTAPQDYFEQFDDAGMLVGWLCQYIHEGVPVPDLLLDRITELGAAAEKSLMELLERVSQTGITVLVVTHEHELVHRFHQRVVTLKNGRIISDIPADPEAIAARSAELNAWKELTEPVDDEPDEQNDETKEKEAATV